MPPNGCRPGGDDGNNNKGARNSPPPRPPPPPSPEALSVDSSSNSFARRQDEDELPSPPPPPSPSLFSCRRCECDAPTPHHHHDTRVAAAMGAVSVRVDDDDGNLVVKAPPTHSTKNAGTDTCHGQHHHPNSSTVQVGGGPSSARAAAEATAADDDGTLFATAMTTTCGTVTTLPPTKVGSQEQHHHAGGVTPLALKGFVDAMELVDPSQKAGYVRAMQVCNEAVLERECCPCYFLVAAKNDPWEAAAKMCRYWKERIDLFGESHAFQALTLGSEAGAPPTGLKDDDVAVVQSGYVQVLPPDHMGRSVLSYDEGQLDATMKERTASRLKVLWYAAQVAYTSGEALAHRLVILVAGQRSTTLGYNPSRPAAWRFALASRKLPPVLPIVVDAVHVLSLSSRFGSGRAVLQDFWAASLDLAGSYLSNFFTMHHGTAGRKVKDPQEAEDVARADLMLKLRALGFTRSGTPDWAGGKVTMEDFRRWVRQRRRLECRALWTENQREQHKRNINRFHSRKKRQRRQHELQALQDKVDQLWAANAQARSVGQTLEKLILQAHDTIQHAFQGSRTRWDDPLPTSYTTGMAPENQYQYYPAVSEVDEFPPGFLASLEPDPIAPHCLPIPIALHHPTYAARQAVTPFANPEIGPPASFPWHSEEARDSIHEDPHCLAAASERHLSATSRFFAMQLPKGATATFATPSVATLHPAGSPRFHPPQEPLPFSPSGLERVEMQTFNPGSHAAREGSTVGPYLGPPAHLRNDPFTTARISADCSAFAECCSMSDDARDRHWASLPTMTTTTTSVAGSHAPSCSDFSPFDHPNSGSGRLRPCRIRPPPPMTGHELNDVDFFRRWDMG